MMKYTYSEFQDHRENAVVVFTDEAAAVVLSMDGTPEEYAEFKKKLPQLTEIPLPVQKQAPTIIEQLDAIWSEFSAQKAAGKQLSPEAELMLGKINAAKT